MKLLRWMLLFGLTLPVIPLFVEAQETNHIAVSPSDQQSKTNSKPETEIWQPPAEITAVVKPESKETEAEHKRFEEIKAKAEKGDAEAEFNLGNHYSKFDSGVPTDAAEAAKWYRKAAEQNYAKAQYELGLCYRTGVGVPEDDVEAVKWLCKAAEQNNPEAQDQLALCYDYGHGVPRNDAEAAKWYRKAAEQNDVFAQENLGMCYSVGRGVPKDYVEAYKWLNLAQSQDAGEPSKTSREWLASFVEYMTPEQIAEAQKLCRGFSLREKTPRSSSGSSASAESPTASGTGFFITEDGYLISNYHVVKDAVKVRLLTSAGTLDAKVVQEDAANDVALLKTEGNFSPLPVMSSRKVQLGNTVATVGFPNITLQGFAPKLAKGEIAALSGAGDDARYFQISVPVQPGNSGGALVDDRGNVVGIVSAKLDVATALAASGSLPENVNYAVKSSFLLSFLESVPDVAKKLKEPNTKDEKFEDVVKSAEAAAVLVLVY